MSLGCNHCTDEPSRVCSSLVNSTRSKSSLLSGLKASRSLEQENKRLADTCRYNSASAMVTISTFGKLQRKMREDIFSFLSTSESSSQFRGLRTRRESGSSFWANLKALGARKPHADGPAGTGDGHDTVTSAGTLPPRPRFSPSLEDLLSEARTRDATGFVKRPPTEDRPTSTGTGTAPRKEPHLGVPRGRPRLTGKHLLTRLWPQLGSPLSKAGASLLSLWEAFCIPAPEPLTEAPWVAPVLSPDPPEWSIINAEGRLACLAFPSPRLRPHPSVLWGVTPLRGKVLHSFRTPCHTF